MLRKQTRFTTRSLYPLKRQYGFRITIHRKTSEELNTETGVLTPTIVTQQVNRAIILPDMLQQKFDYDLAFIASNKNFTYGGLYDTSTRKVIIEESELDGFEPNVNDYYIFDELRWEIAQVSKHPLLTAFVLSARSVVGGTRYQVSEMFAESLLTLNQEVS